MASGEGAAADNQQKTLKPQATEEWPVRSSFFVIQVERSRIMFDMEKQKTEIRKQIISSSIIYKNYLAGKSFLYVFGDEYFEVLFRTNCFKHLTGVASRLSAEDFYSKAKEAKITTEQIFFTEQQPYRTAKKKLVCMHSLPQLTANLVSVIKDFNTINITYKVGITNLDFTIGLMDNLDSDGQKIDDRLIPRTLRINDKSFEKSTDVELVDFIFSKGAADKKYDNVCFATKDASLPRVVIPLLDPALVETQVPAAEPSSALT